jgi:hypothetical protein
MNIMGIEWEINQHLWAFMGIKWRHMGLIVGYEWD